MTKFVVREVRVFECDDDEIGIVTERCLGGTICVFDTEYEAMEFISTQLTECEIVKE